MEIGQEAEAMAQMKAVGDEIQAIADLAPECTSVVELAFDVKGRMTKALDGSARFHRWGKHYLRCIVRSHQIMMQTNFMDRGLGVYGGPDFKKLRIEGDKSFLKLEITRPAPYVSEYGEQQPVQPVYVAPVQAATYYNVEEEGGYGGGGCFGETSTVQIEKNGQ